jgi:small GTP-binding protein
MEKEKKEEKIKKFKYDIILVGSSGVGKSSLIYYFKNGIHKESCSATVGVDFIKVSKVIDKQEVILTIWDTVGDEKFFSVCSSYYKKSDAAILVYDCSNAKSFSEATTIWFKHIEESAPINVKTYLVANKVDIKTKKRSLLVEGESFAQKRDITFKACSAENGVGVYDLFMLIAQELLRTTIKNMSKESKGETAINLKQEEEDLSSAASTCIC